MINSVFLSGNLGQAPDIRMTQDGREIAHLSLATNSSWKNKQGEWQYHTDWHRITVFREATVQWIKESLRKGDSLLIEGKLSYIESDTLGQKRKLACVVVSGHKGEIHLLQSRKVHEKDGGPLCDDENDPPFPDNQNTNNHQSSPSLKDTSLKTKFKERDAELIHPPEDPIVSSKKLQPPKLPR